VHRGCDAAPRYHHKFSSISTHTQQTSLAASPLTASISGRRSIVTAAEIDADVDLSHLAGLLAADARAVLLCPMCPVVEVGAESVCELGVTAFALLAQNVCRLEMLTQQNVVTGHATTHTQSISTLTLSQLLSRNVDCRASAQLPTDINYWRCDVFLTFVDEKFAVDFYDCIR